MARKNTIKKFIENGFYHIYSRGGDGKEIFMDPQDNATFITIVSRYLSPFNPKTRIGYKQDKPSVTSHKLKMNLFGEVNLVSYCLMPNHFHLLIKQNQVYGITQFMRRLLTNYAMYFNTKYHRKGSLFESIYKAVLIDTDEKLVHLTRYIHLNPVHLSVHRFGPVATVATARPEEYEYSSYRQYLKKQASPWLDPGPILQLFDQGNTRYPSYERFVQDYRLDSARVLGPLVIENEMR